MFEDKIIVKTEDLFLCNVCFQTFRTYQLLLHHSMDHDRDISCNCDICGVKLKLKSGRKDDRNTNFLVTNENENNKVSCQVCGAIIKFPDSFSKHMQRHAKNFCHSDAPNNKVVLGGYSVICPTCHEVFYTRSDFIQHVNALHKKTHTCDICNKHCGNFVSYNLHKRLHEDIKIHKCKYCDKIFRYFCNLTDHIKLHHDVRPDVKFSCDICDKTLSSAASLTNHKRLHILHPNRCTYCRKVVTKPGFLKKHLRKHKQFDTIAGHKTP